MKKITDFLVTKRNIILSIMLIFSCVNIFLLNKVNINYDMTKYLPNDSNTKLGINIMESEFPNAHSSSFNIMFENLKNEEKETIYKELSKINGVSSIEYDIKSDKYNKGIYTLYKVNVNDLEKSALAKNVFNSINDKYENDYKIYTNGNIADIYTNALSLLIIVLALLVMITILFIMCESWLDPFLFIITIGIAILLNMGTNSIFESVSNQTHSIAAILQVVLSIDYAIMLINRYRQEKDKSKDNVSVMKEALYNAFKSITSSSLTTIIGLLSLIFMSYTIGKDMGLVLAKGVLLSLICVFTILPALILKFDCLLEKTKKKTLNIEFNKLGAFSYNHRYLILGTFIIILLGCLYLKGNTGITYTFDSNSKIDEVFGSTNTIVVVYSNDQEKKILSLISKLQQNKEVQSINAYANTLGLRLSASELAAKMELNELLVEQVFNYYFMLNEKSEDGKIAIYDFINFIVNDVSKNEQFKPYFQDEIIAKLNDIKKVMDISVSQLVENNHSRMIINTTFKLESKETTEFLTKIEKELSGKTYLIGTSATAHEMSKTFYNEMNFITILTAIAIFIVVVVTFKAIIVPTLLVCVIQTSVFLLMAIMAIANINMNYLALLIVQSILMGATIDYAILYTSYYREFRKNKSAKEAIIETYNKSYHTILTSSFILILVTFIVGKAFTNPTIGDICLTIAKGTTCALVLILFILPGIIASVDKILYKDDK